MLSKASVVSALVICALPAFAAAQTIADEAASASSPPVPAGAPTNTLAAGTPIDIEVLEPVSSKTSRIDDIFAIRLAAPILIDGTEAVPAGITGQGQVVHAAKPGLAGSAGELIIAARFLECGTIKLPLRGFRLGARGTENVGAALAVGLAVPIAGFLVGGKQTVIERGARGFAKLSAEVALPPVTDAPRCAPTRAEAVAPTEPAASPPSQNQ